MLKRQEVTLVITYDDELFPAPSQWNWMDSLDIQTEDEETLDSVSVKGYSEPQDVN